ncbi:Superoxide dismutase [Ni] [Thalassocella blandensis]|nr:Superoxide dismutase [Ni] [Thalassocella blandensis]
MIHSLLTKLDTYFNFSNVEAHCDIPCKIYDPMKAQLAALSVIRFLDLIEELNQQETSLAQQAQLIRLINEKEQHAEQVKHEVRVIWGDYFKQAQIAQFPDIHTTVHNIMLSASACKQHTSRQNGETLLQQVNDFAATFWQTKQVNTYIATCPYPPSEKVVYPDLK